MFDTIRARLSQQLFLYPKYSKAYYGWFKNRKAFQSLTQYCMFIGYPRSGHSLVGSLLDAHPNFIIAHEENALKHVERGCSKQQLFYLLLKNSQDFASSGRKWHGYSYNVPNQWQGSFTNLKIIGDKKGGSSTQAISSNIQYLKNLQQTIEIPIKFIHIVRNPYDNITTITKNNKNFIKAIAQNNSDIKNQYAKYGLESTITKYFKLCETIKSIKKNIAQKDWIDLKHEALIDDPRKFLTELCTFLEVEVTDDYLDDCASIIFKSPHKTRYTVEWNDELINLVGTKIEQFDFLQSYSYEM